MLDLFPAPKPLIGMVHLRPLPGSPRYGGKLADVRDAAVADAESLVEGGCDGLMIENFGDVPFFPGRVPAHVVSTMTTLAAAVRAAAPGRPLGVNVLRNDGRSALAVALAAGANFIRVNVLCGARVTDQGVIEGIAAELLRDRAILGASGVKILADVDVKHSAPLAARPAADEVADTLHRGLADGLVVSGAGTGKPVDPARLAEVKRVAGGSMVFVGSGVTTDSIAAPCRTRRRLHRRHRPEARRRGRGGGGRGPRPRDGRGRRGVPQELKGNKRRPFNVPSLTSTLEVERSMFDVRFRFLQLCEGRRPMTLLDAPRRTQPDHANGSPNGHGKAAPPKRKRGGRWALWLAAAAVVAGVAVGGYFAYGAYANADGAALDAGGATYTVKPIDLTVTVSKNGELQAVDSIEVVNRVEGQTTITYLVPEGSSVKKGDLLVQMDSSKINQEIEDATLNLREHTNNLQNDKELLDIQKTTNAADLEGAQVERDLAELDLRQYQEGTFPQTKADAETALRMADVTLKNKQGDYDDTLGLLNKGFVTQAELKKRELDVISATNDVDKAKRDLDVLVNYTDPHDLAEKKNALSQAEQKLQRVKRQNAANLAQKQNDVDNEEQTVSIRQARLKHQQEQLEATKLTAPSDGLVVYEQGRRDDQRVGEGVQVRERQTILRLPDTSRMKAVLNVDETQVSKLEVGQRATVRVASIPRPVGATVQKVAPVADSGNGWWNPDLRQYPVDLVLDDAPEGAKPGLSCTAEILVDRVKNVPAVPLPAVYSVGPARYVFVPKPDGGFDARKIEVGTMNDTMAQVTGGLKVGETVQLLAPGQGRELLDAAGIKSAAPRSAGPPATRPAA